MDGSANTLANILGEVQPRGGRQDSCRVDGDAIMSPAESTLSADSKSWLAAIVASSDDAIVGKTLTGIIVSWNAAAERLFGYTVEEALGRPVAILAAPDRIDEMPMILGRLRQGQRIDHFETMRRRKNGTLVPVSITVSPVQNDAGQIIGASKIARDISERRHAEERVRMLMHELEHRSKNLLSVVQAIIRLTRAETMEQFKSAVDGRVVALARVNSLIGENRWEGAELTTLMRSELGPFQSERSNIDIQCLTVFLTPEAAQVTALVLHELATNAVKYGALSTPAGRVVVQCSRERDGTGGLTLRWIESNGPAVMAPDRQGFGSVMIEAGITHQLGGKLRMNWSAGGFECEIAIPSKHLVEAPPS